MKEPEIYKQDWNNFRGYCNKRAKEADCYINGKGWQKLREFHLHNYVQSIKNPYGFFFNIRMRHKPLYREVRCMPKYYYKYLKLRQKEFDSPSRDMVEFPSWRGFLKGDCVE
tara:strand:+ start:477 stop:812 length:336 start_codon:yes stop_codon:yes gene_type:complete